MKDVNVVTQELALRAIHLRNESGGAFDYVVIIVADGGTWVGTSFDLEPMRLVLAALAAQKPDNAEFVKVYES